MVALSSIHGEFEFNEFIIGNFRKYWPDSNRLQLHRATKEGGEWSHTHQIAYRAISMEFILELMQGTDLLIGN